jgi:hypothetical protein
MGFHANDNGMTDRLLYVRANSTNSPDREAGADRSHPIGRAPASALSGSGLGGPAAERSSIGSSL